MKKILKFQNPHDGLPRPFLGVPKVSIKGRTLYKFEVPTTGEIRLVDPLDYKLFGGRFSNILFIE